MGLYRDRIFPWFMDRTETRALRTERARALESVAGRVLELGAGTGANLAHYGPEAASVVGVEPGAGMIRRAVERDADAAPPLWLVAADAEALPFPDRTFDAVVAVFVLCTIPRPERALGEARRVLARGGRLAFLEHVRAPSPRLARWQERVEPLWKRLACGCHLARETEAAIRGAGFAIDRIDRFWLPGAPRLVGRMIRGSAAVG